jgi:hypothetical protein
MKHRAVSRAVSRIATPENCAAGPPFRDRTCSRIAREHVHSMGAGCGGFIIPRKRDSDRGCAMDGRILIIPRFFSILPLCSPCPPRSSTSAECAEIHGKTDSSGARNMDYLRLGVFPVSFVDLSCPWRGGFVIPYRGRLQQQSGNSPDRPAHRTPTHRIPASPPISPFPRAGPSGDRRSGSAGEKPPP